MEILVLYGVVVIISLVVLYFAWRDAVKAREAKSQAGNA